jgi:hypothetical protein
MMIMPRETRIPATRAKNAAIASVAAAAFYVNMGLLANNDLIRTVIVIILSSMAMLAIMKHGVRSE